jgi:hypothetical protein
MITPKMNVDATDLSVNIIIVVIDILVHTWHSPITKSAMSFLSRLMFSLQQNQRTRGQNRFCSEAWGRGFYI